MGARMDIDPDNVGDLQKDTARRLKLTRSALGVDQETFGREARPQPLRCGRFSCLSVRLLHTKITPRYFIA